MEQDKVKFIIDMINNMDINVNDNIRMYKKWKIKMYKNEYFYIP